MYQFLSDNIDQLDLALDQLAIQDRNFDRFAHMLIDNVVELILHQFARDRAGENDLWARVGKPKHDPKIIDRSLRRDFESKAKGACSLGLIDKEVCESILNLHSFRNTAYHQGHRHESILHSLAIFYFRIACQILLAYKPRFWSRADSDTASYRAQKYLGVSKWTDLDAIFGAAYKRLDEVAAGINENLVNDLTSDMTATINLTESYIDFIGNNHVVSLEAFEWRISGDPIPSWRERATALSKEMDYNKALKRYCDFMRQTRELRAEIEEDAENLDFYIQQQVDFARGK